MTEVVSVRHWEHFALLDLPDFLRALEDLQWGREWTDQPGLKSLPHQHFMRCGGALVADWE